MCAPAEKLATHYLVIASNGSTLQKAWVGRSSWWPRKICSSSSVLGPRDWHGGVKTSDDFSTSRDIESRASKQQAQQTENVLCKVRKSALEQNRAKSDKSTTSKRAAAVAAHNPAAINVLPLLPSTHQLHGNGRLRMHQIPHYSSCLPISKLGAHLQLPALCVLCELLCWCR